LSAINRKNRLPVINISPLSFNERVNCFSTELGQAAQLILPEIEECARRYRFQEKKIKQICRNFSIEKLPLTASNLNSACANEAYVELGELAQRVKPRFTLQELILPEDQARQIRETLHAMRALTVVHYHWGTSRVWNEGGLSVLFCGSPGTGKTMAAETIAHALDMPMYRIDLSQVVNKYIGETEKNLKRVFDIAELCDCILFFDEADALFGKRTEVKDSNDRFSNIEISYLLERMERFRGLAVLATNRRKDLDDAFIRRLRYIIEFPLPDVAERKRIWENVFPENVDVTSLDMYFLAKNFQLSGGHIRSIAFNACLQSASYKDRTRAAKVEMPATLIALKRELEKMNRSSDDGLFGRYSDLLNINLTEGQTP
ncbi:ATPase, AAA family, partial [hydrothermal vent metagenome]